MFFPHFQSQKTPMIVHVHKIIAYISDCIPLAGSSVRPALVRLNKFLNILLKKGRKEVDSFYILKKVACSGHSKAVNEVKIVFSILKSIYKCGFRESLQVRKAQRLAKSNASKSSKLKKLVTLDEFGNAIQKLSEQGDFGTILGLYVMLATGKRRIDVARIHSRRITAIDGGGFVITLEKDKMNEHQVSFTLNFNLLPVQWRPENFNELPALFERHVEEKDAPFKSFGSSNLPRALKFRPHGLRSIFAIAKTLDGWSDAAIKEKVGWRSDQSLRRYRRLGRSQIMEVGSLQGVLGVVNGHR